MKDPVYISMEVKTLGWNGQRWMVCDECHDHRKSLYGVGNRSLCDVCKAKANAG